MKKGVVILRKVKSVYAGHIYSVQANVELENGQIGVLGKNVAGETEIRELGVNADASSVVVVADPEVNYEEVTKADSALDNYVISANKPARAYEIVKDDEVAVSKGLVVGLPTSLDLTTPKYVVAKAGGHSYEYSATLPTGKTFVAEIIGTSTLGTPYFGQPANYTPTKGGTIELVELRIVKN